MTADKYLIVSLNHDDYGRLILERQLPPGSCFQCLTTSEAQHVAERNAEWGIPVTILRTPEWERVYSPEKARVA